MNPDLLLKYVTVDDMVTTHLWGQEYSFARAEEKSKELGRNIDQFVNIVDLAGLTMSHRQCLKYMRTITALDQQYYPESLGKTFVINAPWIFPALWKLVKAMMDPVTAEKVTVLGGNYKDVLRERFELKDLPAEYGGECRCQSGCIPVFTEQQAVAVVLEAERDLHLEEVTLAAGAAHTVTLRTGEYGGTFTYYWKSFKADVGFQATFTPARPSARALQQQQQQGGGLHHRRKSSAEAKAAEISAAASAASSSVVSEVRECPYGERVWQQHEKFACQQPHKGKFVTDYAGHGHIHIRQQAQLETQREDGVHHQVRGGQAGHQQGGGTVHSSSAGLAARGRARDTAPVSRGSTGAVSRSVSQRASQSIGQQFEETAAAAAGYLDILLYR